MSKKLSIITVCYNEKEVERTCLSVIKQTWQDFEWIVIDGGSESWCTDILEKYREHMTYYVSEKDNGIYAAMNKGIFHAQGEYLLFMNSGDLFLSSKTLEKVSAYFSKNAEVLYGDVVIEMHDDYQYVLFPDKLKESFFFNDCISHQTTYIRAELFQKYGNYDTVYRIFSDYDRWIELIRDGCKFEHLPFLCALYDYKGISSQDNEQVRAERAHILEKYFNGTAIMPVPQEFSAIRSYINPYMQNAEPDAIAITSEKSAPKHPDISVIVPVFNTAPYLKDCLDSLLAQSHDSLEIICVNDGSYDDSLDILKDYAKKDTRLRIYSFEENAGVGTSRNYGLSKAHGEYISFVDSDDWVSLDFYEKLYKCAKSGDYDLVKGGCYLTYGDGIRNLSCFNAKIVDNIRHNKRVDIRERDEFSTYLYLHTFLQNIQAEFPKLSNAEDKVYLFSVLLHKPKCSLIEDTFYYYRQRSNSVHQSHFVFNLSVYLEHFEMLCVLLNNAGISQSEYMEFYFNDIFAGALYYYTSTFLKMSSGENAECLQCICEIIKKCKYLDEFLENPRYQSLKYFATKDIITEQDVVLFFKEIYLNQANLAFSYYKYKLRYKLSRGEKRDYYKHKYLICKKIRKLEKSLT